MSRCGEGPVWYGVRRSLLQWSLAYARLNFKISSLRSFPKLEKSWVMIYGFGYVLKNIVWNDITVVIGRLCQYKMTFGIFSILENCFRNGGLLDILLDNWRSSVVLCWSNDDRTEVACPCWLLEWKLIDGNLLTTPDVKVCGFWSGDNGLPWIRFVFEVDQKPEGVRLRKASGILSGEIVTGFYDLCTKVAYALVLDYCCEWNYGSIVIDTSMSLY